MGRRFGRRALVVTGLVAGAVTWTEVVWPGLSRLMTPGLGFEPIPSAPGYRRVVSTGSMSRALSDPLIGLEVPSSEARPVPSTQSLADPCSALYGPHLDDRVPIAVFTDFNCPYCRVLDRRLFKLAEERPDDVTLKVHHLPLLGETSLWAARGALAARQQDAYIAFHKRLMSAAFVIDPDYLATIARQLGLDEEKLMRDTVGPIVAREIATSRVFASQLGVFGTPGLLVGRTLARGNLSDGELAQLIRMETEENTPLPCGTFS